MTIFLSSKYGSKRGFFLVPLWRNKKLVSKHSNFKSPRIIIAFWSSTLTISSYFSLSTSALVHWYILFTVSDLLRFSTITIKIKRWWRYTCHYLNLISLQLKTFTAFLEESQDEIQSPQISLISCYRSVWPAFVFSWSHKKVTEYSVWNWGREFLWVYWVLWQNQEYSLRNKSMCSQDCMKTAIATRKSFSF